MTHVYDLYCLFITVPSSKRDILEIADSSVTISKEKKKKKKKKLSTEN